ncbi:magnesium chelatase [Myxococcus stipitatus DSM 14675]|uniref:Magnesium chelatase n=1 Tax=Myxococcus stipitatus (strain DSM 14675 / JCM 12634 / Mx s8) TaxID=1278073 RepID=L7U5R3_MYXSD|nr:magnesium chelatase [Myxococcus stipitatus]AGC43200.1 magnesium chelatase [Myxococcus stipitatus DSM 14675]
MTEDLDTLLACASLREDLGSLLLYDAAPALLATVADAWRSKVSDVLGQTVRVVRLGAWTTEEDLWGLSGSLPSPWGMPGLIDDEVPRLVVLGDMTTLSLAGLRACVTLMGAEVASVEREGQSRTFRPRCWWLASCALDDVGQVSPHVLDRFALRVRAPALELDRVNVLRRMVGGASSEEVTVESSLRWVMAARVETRVSSDALTEAVARLPSVPGAGLRGQISLVRMACALARLQHVAKEWQLAPRVDVLVAHVREAARLLQFSGRETDTALEARITESTPVCPEHSHAPAPVAAEAPASPSSAAERTVVPEPAERIMAGSHSAVVMKAAVTSPAEPQAGAALSPLELERTTPIQREQAPLRLPSFRAGSRSATGRGVILGGRPATELRDLSILRTLLAAAPYQRMRQNRVGGSVQNRLLLSREDLRSYRRAPVAQHLLMLVLDFTCMESADWQAALRPYLAEAYIERAQVCIIQLGVAEDELRARRVLARNLLAPSVAQALEASPGCATPLADGLDLAAATLRRMLQVGRNAAHRARLVVFTDGRGNVPLKASRMGMMPKAVGLEGVEDSLHVASQFRGMRQVRAVLLKPPLNALAELPLRLADVLRADVVEVRPP